MSVEAASPWPILTPHLTEARRILERHLPDRWPMLHRVVQRSIAEPMPRLMAFPLAAALAVDGDLEAAAWASASWGALSLFLRLLDDIQDKDRPGGWWEALGDAQTHHMAASCREVATYVLTNAPVSDRQRVRLLRDLSHTMLTLGRGQQRDLEVGELEPELERWWEVMGDKTGELFSWSCRVGVLAGLDLPPTHATVERLSAFGYHLGMICQLVDDWECCQAAFGARDLKSRRLTFPVRLGLAMSEDDALKHLLSEEVWRVEAIESVLRATGALDYTLVVARQELERGAQDLKGCHVAGVEVLLGTAAVVIPG